MIARGAASPRPKPGPVRKLTERETAWANQVASAGIAPFWRVARLLLAPPTRQQRQRVARLGERLRRHRDSSEGGG